MWVRIGNLEYLHGMSAELADIATKEGAKTLSFLYSMAHQEAANLLIEKRRAEPPPIPDSSD